MKGVSQRDALHRPSVGCRQRCDLSSSRPREPLEPLEPLERPRSPWLLEPLALLVPPKPPVPRDEPDMPDPEEPEEPDMPDPEELEGLDGLLLGELGDALRPLCPLMPDRFVSPASSSEADGDRLPLDALRELPSPTDASSRMPRCDDEPDWPCRPDELDCGSPCEPDRPDDPLIPLWFTFDEPEFLSRSVMWRTSFF